MGTFLNILILADSVLEAEQEVVLLEEAGYTCQWERVQTRDEFVARLQQDYDLILADDQLPQFAGSAAVALVRAQGNDIPFIIVSGASEEITSESLKAGATDYVPKQSLVRLVPSVQRALREREGQRQRQRAEEALRESEARFQSAMRATNDVIWEWDLATNTLWFNENVYHLFGYPVGNKNVDFTWWADCVHPQDRERVFSTIEKITTGKGQSWTEEYRFRRADGNYAVITARGSVVRDETGKPLHLIGSMTDITGHKQAEEALQQEAQIAAALARIGHELIVSLDTPTLLDRLCQLLAEVLLCDCSYALLRQPQTEVYVPIASHGHPAEQWELLRRRKVPAVSLSKLLAQLDQEEVVSLEVATFHTLPLSVLAQQYGLTHVLTTALRRGSKIIGILTAAYRERPEPFTTQRVRILRGIGQLASLALEDARLLEELQQADRLKSDFLATMSHELRTPLNIVMGYSDLLLEEGFGPLTPEQIKPLQRIRKAADRELELITTLLDVSLLESGQLAVKEEEVDLQKLLQEIAGTSQDLLQEKPDLRLQWHATADLPMMYTDRAKLKVVLQNLLSNAIKFTAKGTVTMVADSRDEGVEVVVSDTGIGITPEVQAVMFELFRQGENPLTRHYGGVGLGLYTVSRFLELLGGKVAVESEVGKGSTFRIWLPSREARKDFPAGE
jgi:PAS domain S-box-containing protein